MNDVDIRRRLAELAGWEWHEATDMGMPEYATVDGRVVLESDEPLSMDHVWAVCEAVGALTIVWRYDPIERRHFAIASFGFGTSHCEADTAAKAVALALIAAAEQRGGRMTEVDIRKRLSDLAGWEWREFSHGRLRWFAAWDSHFKAMRLVSFDWEDMMAVVRRGQKAKRLPRFSVTIPIGPKQFAMKIIAAADAKGDSDA